MKVKIHDVDGTVWEIKGTYGKIFFVKVPQSFSFSSKITKSERRETPEPVELLKIPIADCGICIVGQMKGGTTGIAIAIEGKKDKTWQEIVETKTDIKEIDFLLS
ncbi:MAG: hypothetical protein QME57_01915 [Patescibacteria group bacterium]|nr:hypothetical protein [Patescibacteria group bacterium]